MSLLVRPTPPPLWLGLVTAVGLIGAETVIVVLLRHFAPTMAFGTVFLPGVLLIGTVWGFGCHDFVQENAFRDSVDEGSATELRLMETIQSGVTLTNAYAEVVQEFQAIGAAA